MIVKLTWKDPDFADQLRFDKEFCDLDCDQQERVMQVIREAGLDEYVTIVVDTITKVAKVSKRRIT